jgi:hypothetical protein
VKPVCKHGHDTGTSDKRYSGSGACKACCIANALRYYAANRAKCGAAKRKWYHDHIEERREAMRVWRTKHRARTRARDRQSRYGITEEQDTALQAASACAACGDPFGGNSYRHPLARHVDHCHASGVVRGSLHHRCNVALGLLGEDPRIIRGLLDYAVRIQKEV